MGMKNRMPNKSESYLHVIETVTVQCLRFPASTAQVGTGLTDRKLRGFPSGSAVKNPPVRQELQEMGA